LAQESNFVIRESKKLNDPLFLKMLLYDQLQYDNPSLQQDAFGLETTDQIMISKEGLSKRFKGTMVLSQKKYWKHFWLIA